MYRSQVEKGKKARKKNSETINYLVTLVSGEKHELTKIDEVSKYAITLPVRTAVREIILPPHWYQVLVGTAESLTVMATCHGHSPSIASVSYVVNSVNLRLLLPQVLLNWVEFELRRSCK